MFLFDFYLSVSDMLQRPSSPEETKAPYVLCRISYILRGSAWIELLISAIQLRCQCHPPGHFPCEELGLSSPLFLRIHRVRSLWILDSAGCSVQHCSTSLNRLPHMRIGWKNNLFWHTTVGYLQEHTPYTAQTNLWKLETWKMIRRRSFARSLL